MEGGDRYSAQLVAKQLLKARSHVSRGQLFLGPPDFGPCTHPIVPTAPEERHWRGRGRGWCQGTLRAQCCQARGTVHVERLGSGSSPEPPLTFRDTVLCRQESLLEQALQHGAPRGPVDQLQHKEVGLPRKSGDSDPAMWLPCPLTVRQRLNTAKGPTSTVMPC